MMNRRVSKIPGRGPASRAADCVARVGPPSAKFQDVSGSPRKWQLPSHRSSRPSSGQGSRLLASAGPARPSEEPAAAFPESWEHKTTRRRGAIVTSRRPALRPAPGARTPRDGGFGGRQARG